MKISRGAEQDGIVVGNTYDKYGSRNPIVRWLMRGFHDAVDDLVAQAAPATIHEIGCGEGYWVLSWNRQGYAARGSDFSSDVIAMAIENAAAASLPADRFATRSIYDLEPGRDAADLLVCCEVLEHLEHPEEGMRALERVATRDVILSVPREPLWRLMNMARGRYLRAGGNTPGHVQHWSAKGFVRFVGEYFDVVAVRTPIPWTMVLCRSRR